MRKPEIILIAAVSRNNVIGIDGKIPWKLPEDLKRFAKLTTPHPVIMGRVTYETIPAKFRPLPERQNVVLTNNTSFHEQGVLRCSSLEDALDVLEDRSSWKDGINYSKIFIGGGQQVYQAAMEYATSLEITHVDQYVEGKEMRYFPTINPAEWEMKKQEPREGYSFATYKRR
ncbi:MAG: dihydrofolate reductase [Nanoarchaeota archaeon]